MTVTVNTKVFKSRTSQPDSVVFAGPNNTLSTVDTLTYKRVLPKPTATFRGVARPTIKRSRDVVVNSVTGETKPAVIEVTGSLPVGMASADITAMVADAAAAMVDANGSALMTNLDLPTS